MRIFQYCLLGFGILLVLTAGFIAGFLFIGKDDLPPEAEDMAIPPIDVAIEDNAYFDVVNAVSKINLNGEKVEFINKIISGKEWDVSLVKEILQGNKEILASIDKIIAYPVFQPPQLQNPEAVGLKTPLISSSGFRNIAKIGAINSLYLFKRDEEKGAFDQAIKIVKLGQLIEDAPRPDIVQDFVARDIKNIGLGILRTMSSRTNLSPDELKIYITKLNNYKANKQGTNLILRNRYLEIADEINETPREKVFWYDEAPSIFKLMARSPFYYKPNQTKGLILNEIKNQINNFRKTYYKDWETLTSEAWPGSMPLFYIKIIFMENPMGKISYESFILDRFYKNIFAEKCAEDFSLAGTQLLIALKSFQIKNGTLPDSLDELAPDYISKVPRDPFDGASIRYSKEKKIIYSVGKDLINSGGSVGEDWREMEDPTIKVEF